VGVGGRARCGWGREGGEGRSELACTCAREIVIERGEEKREECDPEYSVHSAMRGMLYGTDGNIAVHALKSVIPKGGLLEGRGC
jgi:hypothetical protein